MPRPAFEAQLRTAEAHLGQADPILRAVIRRHGPCGLGRRRRDPFDTLATSIVSQQLSTKAADTIRARVLQRVGARSRLRPEHFAELDDADLRACGLSWSKAAWLRELALRVRKGTLSFAALRKLDDESAIEALDALPGVGRWTAEMFLMFALDRLDLYAMGDVGLRRSVDELYGKGRKLSERRTLAITRVWAPYRTVASWYLWRQTDAESESWG